MTTRRAACTTAPGEQLCRWVDRAACADLPGLPWTADASTVTPTDRHAMTLVCVVCPVATACRAAAQDVGEVVGFWAGAHRDLPAIDETADVLPLFTATSSEWVQVGFTWPIGGAA